MIALDRFDIDLLDAGADRVRALLSRIQRASPMAAGVLFAGDRWQGVDVCAVAVVDGADVGLATLAPPDELGQGGPQLIGAWVDPTQRRQGIGCALLAALAEESVRRYGQPPRAEAVTPSGWRTVQAAARTAPLTGINLAFLEVELL